MYGICGIVYDDPTREVDEIQLLGIRDTILTAALTMLV